MLGSCLRAGALLVLLAPAPVRAAASTAGTPPDSLYAHQDWAHAAEGYERLTRAEPANGRAWYRLGVSLQQSGRAPQAIPAYRKAADLGFAPAFTWYNLACAYAITKDADHAFAALDTLLAKGYRQPQALEAEGDFASIRGDARWAATIARAKKAQFPCTDDPRSRELDFWVGEWNVQDRRSGAAVGTSSVQLILGSCVVFENWTGLGGGAGKSFNSYNRATGWWQQNWVSDGGQTNDFVEGKLEGNAMVYHGTGKLPDGTIYPTRLSFFNLGPDQVRQFSEYSTDGGKTWAVGYDFLYVRKKDAAAAK